MSELHYYVVEMANLYFQQPPLTQVGQDGMELAKELGHTTTYPIHLLYGLSRSQTPTASFLHSYGMTPETIRAYLTDPSIKDNENFSPLPYHEVEHGWMSIHVAHTAYREHGPITYLRILRAILSDVATWSPKTFPPMHLPIEQETPISASRHILNFISYLNTHGHPNLSLDTLLENLSSVENL